MEDRIFDYLARRPATPEHLQRALGADANEVHSAVDEMAAKGWVVAMQAWFGNDPASGVTVFSLTPSGRQEAAHRRVAEESQGFVIVTRDELIAQLRQLGWTEEQITYSPGLRHDYFYFWPDPPAFAAAPDADGPR
jgi:hypothetical protein